MKSMLSKLWKYIGETNGLLLIIYCTFVFLMFTLSVFPFGENSLFGLFRWICFVMGVLFFICSRVIRFAQTNSIQRVFENNPDKNEKLMRIIVFTVPFILFFVKYLIYYPGAFSVDSLDQYSQVVTNHYNDWHPVIQTLISFKLPLSLTNGWIGSISLFQIITISLTISYSLISVYKYTNVKYTIVALLFVLLNPQISNIALFPWKDVSFAIGALLLVTYVLHIYFTSGSWIKKPVNIVAFVVVLSLTTLFRHNAILFTLPLLFSVLFLFDKKRFIIVCLCFAALTVSVKGPVYSAINVESPDNRQSEMLGLPMTVIGAAVSKTPEKLDSEVLDFAYKIAPKEVWQEEYVCGSYNYVKFHDQTNNDVIDEYGAAKVLSMALKCFINSPICSLKALIKLTEVSYAVCNEGYIYVDLPMIVKNSLGIEQKGLPALQTANSFFSKLMFEWFPTTFMHTGTLHMILIISILAKCKLNKLKDWKKILLILPVFAYNFGTTLLLTGAEDSSRFFMYTFMIVPVLLVMVYKKDCEKGADEKVPSTL